MKYVAETDRRFDVIIVDSTDPQGPGAVLFTKNSMPRCKRCLEQGGVMVTQNGVPIFQPDELVASDRQVPASCSRTASCYVAAIPTYVGGHMAMGWATDDKKLRQQPAQTIAARYKKAGSFKTKYWTPEVHDAAFALPRFIAEHRHKGEEALISSPALARTAARALPLAMRLRLSSGNCASQPR